LAFVYQLFQPGLQQTQIFNALADFAQLLFRQQSGLLTRAPALDLQQTSYLIKTEPGRLSSSDKSKPANISLTIAPYTALWTFGLRKQAPPLVIANRLDMYIRGLCQPTDGHGTHDHCLTPYHGTENNILP